MDKCPRCGDASQSALYQCTRCFTIYCNNCNDSKEGKTCPKCHMAARLMLPTK